MEIEESKLKDVPETMLWTLHNRASEAMRHDGIINDDRAVTIYKNIKYDYEKSFGKADASHAIRSLDFDREIRRFLSRNPNGTIVNLGEGLETQRFRIDETQALWITVDLPEAIEIRERYIEPDDRHLHLPFSALNKKWLDSVPKDKPVFLSAQGLFMYLKEEDVKTLLKEIEVAFEHWYLMFDTIPEWLSKKTLSEKGWAKTPSYTTPRMPWGINRHKIKPTIRSWFTDDVTVTDMRYSTFPRGLAKWSFLLISTAPVLKNMAPTIVKIEQRKS